MKNQTIFDIYTEDIGRDVIICALLSFGIGSFTLIPVSGFDEGRSEKSLIIRIIGSATLLEKVRKIGWNIKSTNLQATVLLSTYRCITELL